MHNNNTMHHGMLLLAGAALAMTMACAMEEPRSGFGSVTEEVEATVLAELTSADGVAYTFLEVESGEVAVTVVAPGPVDPARLPGPNTSLAALYERVSGQPAPEALVLAETRAAENSRDSANSTPVEDRPSHFSPGDALPGDATDDEWPEDVGASTQDLTAGQFRSMYCPKGGGSYDFLYCWPDTGGNPWVQRTAVYFAGAMNATTCTTRFRYRYYVGGWRTFRDRQALPGEHFWYYMSGGSIPRRWEILDNAGCGVRFSAWGNL